MKSTKVQNPRRNKCYIFNMDVHTCTVERLILGNESVYDSAEMVNSEIEQVARLLTEVAEELLPCVQPKRRSRFRDYVLSRLCAKSCAARAAYSSKGP